jgi:mono/diheme cytochrome c family protein
VKSRNIFVALLAGCCWLAGCGPVEMRYVLSEDTKNQIEDPAAQEQLAAALDEYFGTPAEPVAAAPLKTVFRSTAEQLASGAESYRRLCMHCHGLSGDGDGPTAGPKERPWLFPRPRDYRRGLFKFTSTAGTSTLYKPTRDDLMRTIKNGIGGTSMPSFLLFDDDEMNRLLDYVILLSIRGETERNFAAIYQPGDPIDAKLIAEEAEAVAGSWVIPSDQIVRPKVPRPSADAESLTRGKKLYLDPKKGQCVNCHGPEGRGDGWEIEHRPPSERIDSWGNETRPADLTLGVFRGGGRPIDLFRRFHAGVKGGIMPAQSITLSDEEIWDLVNYVRALAYEEAQASAASTTAGHGPKTN